MTAVCLEGCPDLLALQMAEPAIFPCLLQSTGQHGWDILFAFPQQMLLFEQATLANTSFFDRFHQLWQQEKQKVAPQLDECLHLPFRGGWFVYLGYELLHQIEPSVEAQVSDDSFPIASLIRIPCAIMVNRTQQKTWLFAETEFESHLSDMEQKLARTAMLPTQPIYLNELQEEDEEIYLAGINQVKRYIHQGDVFQVNLSRAWHASLSAHYSSSQLYANLRQTNPAPFSGIANFGDYQIVSSSPERLLKVSQGLAETRPIAGTHPRSASPEMDLNLRQQLIASSKERAEHIMLIDLERNDLGRVCIPGSIRVNELMNVHSYAFVHHIESNITGRLRPDVAPIEAIRALFPGGTITGCPKVRTMQIIHELETSPRLAYTGSMGYLNHDGSLDLNILIRSFMQQGNQLTFRAGAGIVADSDPHKELAETRAKAKGLLRALGVGK